MRKVLIVEDDKEIGKLLSESFSSQGYKCHIVGSWKCPPNCSYELKQMFHLKSQTQFS